MRRLAILALLAALALPAMAAPAVVLDCANEQSAPAANVTVSCSLGTLTVGDQVIVVGMSTTTGQALSASGCSLSFTSLFSDTTGSNGTWDIWTATVSSAVACSPSVLLTWSSGYPYDYVGAWEISGAGASDATPIDGNLSYCTSCTSTAITTATSGDIVLFVAEQAVAGTPFASFNPFTLDVQVDGTDSSGQTYDMALVSDLPATVGNQSTTFTAAGSRLTLDLIMAFKPSAGPPPCPHTLMTLGVGCG